MKGIFTMSQSFPPVVISRVFHGAGGGFTTEPLERKNQNTKPWAYEARTND